MKLRFAPSPTGWLHVGNARIALANALVAARSGGTLLLRLDDTDMERSRVEYADGIVRDLSWLGIFWNETFRQSDRRARYDAAAARLRRSGRLYPCFESEEELRAKRDARIKRGQAPVYDRAMLSLTAAQRAAAEANGKTPYWRFLLSPREIAWDDLVLGRRRVKLPAVSDPVLIRADGTPLYTFTSAVDDLESGITHVVRGEDHVTNTGVQIDLLHALGAAPDTIRFAHLPLLVDTEGGKLSKRLESLSLRTLRQDGIEPDAIAAYLAALGTPDPPEPMPWAALADRFDLGRVSRSPPRFDMRQLLAVNRRVLHALPFDAVRDRLPADTDAAFWDAVRGNLDFVREARDWLAVVHGPVTAVPMPGEAGFLRAAADALPAEPWAPDTFGQWTAALKEQTGRAGKALFTPLRRALTGEEHGPEMARLLPLIGRVRTLARLEAAAAFSG